MNTVPGSERIAVVGLGYVGLPVAVAFSRHYSGTIGYDRSERRIAQLLSARDVTGEVDEAVLREVPLTFTSDPQRMAEATLFIVTVPTPIDANRQPDFEPLLSACRVIGRVMRPGAVVVFESTVYPGATEEVCGSELARVSGLRQGVDFKLGYSPERINPGDREHTLERIVKVVSGEDEETLNRVAEAYGRIIDAGIHRAPTIMVAEAAKVIENTQRDLNIALMNELALIFDRLGIRTHDVLTAAGTKWNFLPFTPGLVGGHCIGIDPYYLTAKAKAVGYYPQVILAGRRLNDGMGSYLAQRLVKLLIERDHPVKRARVGVLGLTFKENVPDLRNSRVPDIVAELRQFGIEGLVHDPLAYAEEARAEYGIELSPLEAFDSLHALVLAVPHSEYLKMLGPRLFGMLRPDGVVVDVKSAVPAEQVPPAMGYWSL